jgi:hypothetical protein
VCVGENVVREVPKGCFSSIADVTTSHPSQKYPTTQTFLMVDNSLFCKIDYYIFREREIEEENMSGQRRG